ncbi:MULTISPECIES: MarR family winged helix-turn-helix transcriptional regulator [Streptomyces]|uniref:MarR family winged helix-turn-helix transcriptional regulator n=1 Tax=Streptomyces TaxID=1883 RepID=UPI000CF2FA2D|nr:MULTISPECIES: MarR family transcriptional regulator [Streptomyces]PPS73392.1 MarR family transcriptional regulator [Streptomyces sp. 46]
MHEECHTANLLGAAALALSDVVVAEATRAVGTSSSGAAALVVLSTHPGLSVTELGRRVGLSQSAAARMVDGLEKQGLVRKEASWGAWVSLQLSDGGAQAARTLLACRSDVLRQALNRLDDGEREQLGQLLSKVLTDLYRQAGDAERICRLCDRRACVRNGATCPVGQADRDHRASHESDHG